MQDNRQHQTKLFIRFLDKRMACINDTQAMQIMKILQSNNAIKHSTSGVLKEYLELQQRFFTKASPILNKLPTINSIADIFLTDEQKKLLDEFKPNEKVQLAVCGYNSVGKTTFIHDILGLGNFLPTGIGAVSARIAKFSYAPAHEARLVQLQSDMDPNVGEHVVDLSGYFTPTMNKSNIKKLREAVNPFLARRKEMDENSPEFELWASHFIEIYIPSSFLKLGIDIYDSPGFLGSDPPILAQNLLKLVGSVSPSLVYLYDNPVVSDDSRKCFEQLRLALSHNFRSIGIFFLNTKADVLTIRKDAEDEDDDEDEDEDRLLNREREKRYKLLLDASELSSTISDGDQPAFDTCDCFDIFSSQGSTDALEGKMKEHAINKIVRFAAEHDLRSTKRIIQIVLGTIDDFFDFVLVTNRRSKKDWTNIRDCALEWIDEYFTEYQSKIEYIANEAQKQLPIKFGQLSEEIEKRALPHCQTRWWEKVYLGSHISPLEAISSSPAIEYINMTVENEVIKPVLSEITSKISLNAKAKVDQTKLSPQSTKNELLMAAYRTVMVDSAEYGSFYSQSSLGALKIIGLALISPLLLINAGLGMITRGLVGHLLNKSTRHLALSTTSRINIIERQRREGLHQYLLDLKENIWQMSEQIKDNMQKWLENSRKECIERVNLYYQMVTSTLDQRRTAYDLSREFAPAFTRVECCLVAKLDLAKHHGSFLTIERDVVLGQGGFFTIHPARWDSEENLVVKRLINVTTNRDIAYIEAHFYRAITRLQIPHVVPLRYLYETAENPQEILIVLPRFPKSLYTYLMERMRTVTIDKAVQISLSIAEAITYMHAHELVHRDIKVQNTLIDANEQVFLADFGTCQHGVENSTFIGTLPFVPELTTGDHQYSYQGSAFDIFCLGIFMYAVAPKDVFHQPRTIAEADVNSLNPNRVPESYRNLIRHCIRKEPETRPTAVEVVAELKRITTEIANIKPCLVCLDAPRSARCLPCQHKTMCAGCLKAAQAASSTPECIICRQVFTGIEQDTIPDTFIHTTAPSAPVA